MFARTGERGCSEEVKKSCTASVGPNRRLDGREIV